MLFAKGTSGDGRECLMIGLSRGNIERLLANKPIRITRHSHGDILDEREEIVILFGETEQAIADTLRGVGLIGPQTKQTIDPRLDHPSK